MAEQKNVQEQDLGQLLKVRREKLAALQEEGKDPFKITSYHVTHHSNEIKEQFDSLEGKEVSVAGRMMFKRVMGKASFCQYSGSYRETSRYTLQGIAIGDRVIYG